MGHLSRNCEDVIVSMATEDIDETNITQRMLFGVVPSPIYLESSSPPKHDESLNYCPVIGRRQFTMYDEHQII